MELGIRHRDEQPTAECKARRRRSRSISGKEAYTPSRTCPICLDDMLPSMWETFGCGIHFCCAECAKVCARDSVNRSLIPRCWEDKCRHSMDVFAAHRLLDNETLEHYLELMFWSNGSILACPKCVTVLYRDPDVKETRGVYAICPSCSFKFCPNCKCASHPGIECDAAVQREITDTCALILSQEDLCTVEDSEQMIKVCPRCRAPIQKADEESCNHMTCLQCRYEFCWICLADRRAISAHGCHHHWPHCRFYCSYKGPDRWLPDDCDRCRQLGVACRTQDVQCTQPFGDMVNQYYYTVLDFCKQFVEAVR